MPVGLQTWNEFGVMTLDTNDRLTRVIGVIPYWWLVAGGSYDFGPALYTGITFWTLQFKSGDWNAVDPIVTQSGTTLYWTPGDNASSLVVGVY